MNRCHHQSRRGFILVMILMLLAIAAVALVAAGRSSMGLAVNAVQARQELQQRWGGLSCRRTALALAPLLFQDAEEDSGGTVRRLRAQLDLGGQTFFLTVSDEQAKANVNEMLRHRGREVTRAFVRSQVSGTPGAGEVYLPMDNPTQNRDTGPNTDAAKLPRKIISLNHLLPRASPQDLIGTQDDDKSATAIDTLTCWGDGRINILRASDDLIEQVCSPMLGRIQINRLRSVLQATEEPSLAQVLANIGLAEEDVPAVTERLTLESNCYSVWVVVDNGKRRWYELGVAELATGDGQADGVEADAAGRVAPAADPVNPRIDETIAPEASGQGVNEIPGAGGNEQASTVENADNGGQPRYYLYQW